MFCAAVQAGPGRLVGAGTMLSGSIPFALMRAWPLPDAYAVERMRRDRQDQLPGEPQRSIFSQLGLARYAAPLSLSSGRRRNALVTLPRPAPPTPPKINPKAIPRATFPKAKPKTTPVAMPTTIAKPARSVGLNSLSPSVVFLDTGSPLLSAFRHDSRLRCLFRADLSILERALLPPRPGQFH